MTPKEIYDARLRLAGECYQECQDNHFKAVEKLRQARWQLEATTIEARFTEHALELADYDLNAALDWEPPQLPVVYVPLIIQAGGAMVFPNEVRNLSNITEY